MEGGLVIVKAKAAKQKSPTSTTSNAPPAKWTYA